MDAEDDDSGARHLRKQKFGGKVPVMPHLRRMSLRDLARAAEWDTTNSYNDDFSAWEARRDLRFIGAAVRARGPAAVHRFRRLRRDMRV